MVRARRGLPRSTATCAHTVLTECVSAVVRSMTPNCSLLKLLSGTPETLIGLLPLSDDAGVYLPESRAEIAVTTLNVEPGA